MGEADTADGKRVKTVSGGLWRKTLTGRVVPWGECCWHRLGGQSERRMCDGQRRSTSECQAGRMLNLCAQHRTANPRMRIQMVKWAG